MGALQVAGVGTEEHAELKVTEDNQKENLLGAWQSQDERLGEDQGPW